MSNRVELSRKPPHRAGELSGTVSFRRGLATPYTLGIVALFGGFGAGFPGLLHGVRPASPGATTSLFVGGFFLLLGIAFIVSAERVALGRRKIFETGVLVTGRIIGFGNRRTVFRSAPTPTAIIRFEVPGGGEKSLETPLFGPLGPEDLPEGSEILVAWAQERGQGFPLIPRRRDSVINIEEANERGPS